MAEPGNLLRHIHSKTLYWYTGKVPDAQVVTIVPKGETATAYTISYGELNQYYEIVRETEFEVGQTYKSKLTEATLDVEAIYINPDTGENVAFGWYSRVGADSRTATTMEHRLFHNWELVTP